ncbi:MAG: CHASE2 domain-containing protein [Oligoflexales bacterium]|nr:CHASE2 domain-containing protein [Oligoflexales bacterium]
MRSKKAEIPGFAKGIESVSRKMGRKFKKAWMLVLLCILVVSASWWILFHHYKTFNFNGPNDFVYRIESKLLDFRMKVRGPLRTTGKVGILAIDEKSIESFGRWPFSRKYYSQAFRNLKKHGVKWIGFDSIFSEPERTALEDVTKGLFELETLKGNELKMEVGNQIKHIKEMMRQSPSDINFAEGIKEFNNIVLGYFFFGSEWEANLNLGKGERFQRFSEMNGSRIEVDIPKGKTLND